MGEPVISVIRVISATHSLALRGEFDTASRPEMTQENSKTVSEINGMGNRSIGETVLPHTQTSNSPVVGEPSAAPASPPRKALRGVLERRWRRKNDINSLHGLIREHSRVIAAMHSGRIPLEKGEVLSRAYARHREMVSAYEQQSQLAAIQAQLEALRSERALLPIDAAPRDREVKE